MSEKKIVLYLVVPCYNEQDALPYTSRELSRKLNGLIDRGIASRDSRILFVDDGSEDSTWEHIEACSNENALVTGICLSRNCGHQKALMAGLMTSKNYADAVISLDADLQDDVDAIDKMVEEFLSGCDIVYGVRSDRKKDTAFKRCTALGFYRFMKLLGVDIVYNHADYRLMSKRALDALSQFEEANLFLRGIVPLIGFKTATVQYKRDKRVAGKSKYSLAKMLSFAFSGITSFSIKPIRMIFWLGVIIFIISLFVLLWFLLLKLFGHTVTGWTSIVASIWMIGGIQLLCLGVVGEYIGKVYSETKRRPRFFISRNLLDEKRK